VNRRRLEMLDTAERQAATDGSAPQLEQVLEAFVVPPVDMWQEGERGLVVLGLFSRAMVEWRTQFEHVQKEVFSEILHRFVPALRRNLSHLDDDELGWRFHFMIGALAIGVQSHRRMRFVAPEFGESNEGMERLDEYLITYLAAAFRAPASKRRTDRSSSEPQRATPTALGKERD